jgi:hypothetical protein
MANESDFVIRLKSDPKFFVELLFEQDVKQAASTAGFLLNQNFLHYVEDTLEKVRIYLRDQAHVLEIKSNQTDPARSNLLVVNHMLNSGGNGAAGTGW